MKNACRKTVLGLLLGIFAICVAANIFIDQYYFIHLPKVPNDASGRTEKLVVSHGSVRYASARELQTFQRIQHIVPLAGLPFLIAIGLGWKWGIFKIRGNNT